MPYTPDEYEKLKAAYKEELKFRKATLEVARRAYLRQKAEWHLAQMQSALEALGYSDDPSHSSSDSTASPPQTPQKTPVAPSESIPPTETKTLF